MLTTELKQTIIQKFLQENPLDFATSKNLPASPYIGVHTDLTTKGIDKEEPLASQNPFYSLLSNALESLEKSQGETIDFMHVLTDRTKWAFLAKVLRAGLQVKDTLSSQSHSQGIPQYNEALIFNTMEDESKRLFLETLAKPDYYNREVLVNPPYRSQEIDRLILCAKKKMIAMLDIEAENSESQLTSYIHQLDIKQQDLQKKSTTLQASQDLSNINKKLLLAQDLMKLYHLEALAIPLNYKDPPVFYYTLLETAGGVTEKIALIRADLLQEKLSLLLNNITLTLDRYYQLSQMYKLCINGILKFPKYSKIETYQSEAAALTLSKLLGNNTTEFYCVSWHGEPALFIPFNETLKLMQLFANGNTYHTWNLSKTYLNYSTINPIGESFSPNPFIPDLGNALPLFYICSDPDSMGGYNQNKGLTQQYEHGPHEFFVFDQSIQTWKHFSLNSALCLHSSHFIFKHTRHGQGRNHTLIDDSSYASKYVGLMNLLKKKSTIEAYFNKVKEIHEDEIAYVDNIRSQLEKNLDNLNKAKEKKEMHEHLDYLAEQKSSLRENIKAQSRKKAMISILNTHNKKLKDKVQERIAEIASLFPKKIGHIDEKTQYKILLLEKLIHHPVLFNPAGRPYQYPWTSLHTNPVKEITRSGQTYIIKFSAPLSESAKQILSKLKLPSLTFFPPEKHAFTDLRISADDLATLQENMLYPERSPELIPMLDYLNKEHLAMLKVAYGKSNRTEILVYVNQYKALKKESRFLNTKLQYIDAHLLKLKHYLDKIVNKSFGRHISMLIELDYQQHLQNLMGLQKPTHLTEAFLAARKLDRSSLFNQIISNSIINDRLRSKEFLQFLEDCIHLTQEASDYESAITASIDLKRKADYFLNQNPKQPQPREKLQEEDKESQKLLTRFF